MNWRQFQKLTQRYPQRRIAVVGDFCLDRYLEIDPAKMETSLETGLPVYNVVRTRSHPGAAGTIVNNLAALGLGQIFAVGFCGHDSEGWELERALRQKPGVCLDHFIVTDQCRTFTYTKPLIIEPGQPPRELNRLDIKNWTPTPSPVTDQLSRAIAAVALDVDAFILLDQVEIPETGVLASAVLQTIAALSKQRPELLFVADARRGLISFPPVIFKMNRQELARFYHEPADPDHQSVSRRALELANRNNQPVFVTLAENGIVAASPPTELFHQRAFPVRGPIDVVGAGDAVTANLTAALSAGATVSEAVELANAAASVVVHQLGTTGTATVAQIESLFRETGQMDRDSP